MRNMVRRDRNVRHGMHSRTNSTSTYGLRATTGRLALAGLALTVLLVTGPARVSAQEQETDAPAQPREVSPISVGVLGGYSFNLYNGSLDIGTDIALGGGACAVLGSGFGGGAAFGAFGEYRLSPTFSLGLRGVMENRSGAMEVDAPAAKRRASTGELETVESIYRFEVEVSTPSVELYGMYTPFSFPLQFALGPKIGIASSPAYEFAEELLGDDESAFANGTKRQVYASGSLSAPLLFGVGGGASYLLPMGGGFDLVPEVYFSTYLNGLVPDQSAPTIAGFRPSVSLRYTFGRPRPEPPTFAVAEPTPPPPPPAPELAASIEGHGISPEGETTDRVLINVKERVRRREIALLPYVFFDLNSATIPDRYLKAEDVPENEDIVTRYRQVLNLLGERMTRDRSEQITLVGTNSNVGSERGQEELSRKRAESVRDYLVKRWGVDPSRIAVEARNLPESPSNNSLPGGQAENRRVEIVGSESLMAPLLVEDTVRTYSSPGLRLDSEIDSDIPFSNWEIRIAVGDRVIRNLKGGSILKNRIDESFQENELRSLSQGSPLIYGIAASDESGKEARSDAKTIDVNVVTEHMDDVMLNDTSISVSTPVLFGYNSSELDERNWQGLMRLRNLLPAGSKLTITGYADSLGESGYNRALSERRAQTVAQVFDNFDVTIVPAGERPDLAPDNTPESRFYARTVKVEVERK